MSRDLIGKLVSGPEGYVVEIFGLMIYRLESGDYSVTHTRNDKAVYAGDFENLDMALDKFFELRERNQIGFDFETER